LIRVDLAIVMMKRRPDRASRTLSRRRQTLAGSAVALAAVVATVSGCASGPSTRSLHYIDDQLVVSQPVHHASYAAYLRARLALEAQPADLITAAREIELALKIEPKEPHLWTTLAEVELQRGDREAAIEASRMALQLRPEYGPAQQLLAKLEGAAPSASTMSSRVEP